METYLAPRSRFEKQTKIDDKYFHLTLLAENQTGWQNLIQLATKAHLEGFYYKPRVDKELLKQYRDGLIALSGCLGGEVPQLILNNKISEAEKTIKDYQEIFGPDNFFLEIGHHPNIPEVAKANKFLIELSRKTGAPLVATQDIHYLKPEDAEYHDILLAVQTKNKLSDDDRLTLKADDFSMRSPEQMIEFFRDTPEAIENTVKIAERCNVNLTLNKILLPKFSLPEGETDSNSYLRRLVMEKLSDRFPEADAKVIERLEYELGVIEKTGFADYFLIVQDIVNWAKERGIVVGPGRGSAAGSLISYVLGITDIDPLKYDLLFERFLNPNRVAMPDIDIDFTDIRRNEVFAYVRQKYGEDRVAQIITFGTMAARAAARDAGRALGISYSFCDMLAKLIPFNSRLDEALENVSELKELYQTNSDAKKIIDAARDLEGVVRHASVHACGIVITKEPLTNYLPLQRAPQNPEIIITQFEMHSVEDLGLLKMDLLGLKNLTIIEETVRLVKEMRGEEINVSQIPLIDKKTFKLLQAGDTTAVFQLESSGMRRYLKELKPNEFEDIIAMVALYRPGPIELISSFIKRKHGKEKIKYLHPKLEPILKNTYAICIYQEQVMKIAQELAGFTLAEADILRKAIGKKIKSLLLSQKEKFIEGVKKNNIKEETANQLWTWIEPFARYSFNRSHAACYALIAYRTAYLKAHYPIEFMTALFNADSGDIERISFLVDEARKAGIKILPPDINASFSDFIPEDNGIRFGLLAIKNVGVNIVEAIIAERNRGGPFANFQDFITRIQHKDLNKKSLESLAKAGVFDSLGIERNSLILNIEEILAYLSRLKRNSQLSQNSLFGVNYSNGTLKLKSTEPASNKEKLFWEKELLGFYLSDHPLNEYLPKISSYKAKPIKKIIEDEEVNSFSKESCRIAGIICKTQRILTKVGKSILFVKLEDLSGSLEIVVFSDTLNKNPAIWRENNVVVAQGRLSWRNNEPRFICESAVEL